MDSAFMEFFARGLGQRGCRVARFEFPYMAARRNSDRQPPPDREPKLRAAWLEVVERLGPANLFIGGKSLGGRIASLVAMEAAVAGLVCLGYPFHPPGSPTRLRVKHLPSIAIPTLIVQGERDPFGTRAEVEQYPLSPSTRLVWLADGDHSFKPRKSSGRTEEQNWNEALDAIATLLNQHA